MAVAPKLAEYRRRRDFAATPEPAGTPGTAGGNSFVIQKHAATRLHYDFRLELDGVMKSWAVTKGPSLVPGEKRLAVETEDHPIAYNAFEGVIPKGQYGGGTVMIWDRGQWFPEFDPHKGLAKGHLEFRLEGEKLHGRWHLVRMRRRAREKHDNWLLLKAEDEEARGPGDPDILETAPQSAESGRSMDEIAKAADRVWQSKPRNGAAKKAAAAPPPKVRGGRKAAMPDFVPPALASLTAKPPVGKNWLHEIKFDGYRLQARIRGGEVALLTRRGLDWTTRFPAIAQALAALGLDEAMIDGEAVVEDAEGRSSFQALQEDLAGKASQHSVFYVFDLLHLDGKDLTALPLTKRKALLAQVIPPNGDGGTLRLSEHIDGDGAAMLRHACRLGLEGIVSKRADARYASGRGHYWLKAKCAEREEFVIAGYVVSTVSAKMIGSLVLGYFDKAKLVHVGRVGTGFTTATARDLFTRLDALRQAKSPFATRLATEAARGVRWVAPELVAEIEYRGWTGDGMLRHAAFKGLREDKPAEDVTREDRIAMPDPPAEKSAKAATPATPGTVAGVRLTHPDRVLWAEQGLTKEGLAAFYADIADWLLPHVVHRPLSLVRCPSGEQKHCFFQKHAWAGLHPAIRSLPIEGEDEPVLAVEDIAGVIGLVQAGVLEIHPWGATLDDVERPDRLIFDFDPDAGRGWADVVAGAREVRERLKAAGLESFVKTTGGKGLHVVVPLVPSAPWDEAKEFTQKIASAMAADAPDRYTDKLPKRERVGRIFIDYLRNGRGATAVAAYSTRARPNAPVSTPLAWDELDDVPSAAAFTVANLRARLSHLGRDPWDGFFEVEQSLAKGGRAPKAKPRRKR
jgi:bifunctional non-homologous end joining protein LigD